MNREELTIYRRRLPHWRVDESVYFVTWRLAPGQSELAPAERDLVQAAMLHFQKSRYRLTAYVVMNDHIHALVQPIGGHSLQDIVRSWKSYTAHQLVSSFARKSPVWQGEYFDRIVRDDAEFREKAQYILNNPWKRWPEVESYPWVGCFWPEERRESESAVGTTAPLTED